MDDKLKKFEELVARHDLTFDYSDAPMVWREGRRQLEEIKALAKELPQEEVRTIWNAKVDRVISEGHRAYFYWR